MPTVIDSKISYVQAYSQIKELSFILKTCKLKPLDKKLVSTSWYDEYHNLLKITPNKNIIINYNDLSVPYKPTSDLYFNLSIDKIVKISKYCVIYLGQDESQDIILTSFLGVDNKLRAYLYIDEWTQVSPLLLGVNKLKQLYYDVNKNSYYQRMVNSPLPCDKVRMYVAPLPIKKETTIKQTSPMIYNLLTGDKYFNE